MLRRTRNSALRTSSSRSVARIAASNARSAALCARSAASRAWTFSFASIRMRADRASGSRTRRSGYSVLPTVRSAQSPSRCASAPLPCRARPVDRPIDTRVQSTISAVVRAAEPAGRDCSLAPAADEGFIAYQGAAFDAVAIGASAGGVTALQAVIGALPARFPAAVLVVQHLDPRHKSLLADLLDRHAQMAVKEAVNGERIEPGTVYIAPPDTHLLVANGHISLTSSELVHFTRPSVDL